MTRCCPRCSRSICTAIRFPSTRSSHWSWFLVRCSWSSNLPNERRIDAWVLSVAYVRSYSTAGMWNYYTLLPHFNQTICCIHTNIVFISQVRLITFNLEFHFNSWPSSIDKSFINHLISTTSILSFKMITNKANSMSTLQFLQFASSANSMPLRVGHLSNDWFLWSCHSRG